MILVLRAVYTIPKRTRRSNEELLERRAISRWLKKEPISEGLPSQLWDESSVDGESVEVFALARACLGDMLSYWESPACAVDRLRH